MNWYNQTRNELETEWHEWKIPMQKGWEIIPLPPFNGAIARFRIIKGKAEVSIYLDCYDRLGWYGKPYWEMYPYSEDVFRCDMDDVDSLVKAITYALKQQNK